MTQFAPTIRISEPAAGPDRLAGGLLASLSRPLYRALSIGVVGSFTLTVFTFGIVLLPMLIRWLRQFIGGMQQQLWHLSEWMRVQSGDNDAGKIQEAAQQIRFHVPLALLTALFTLIAVGAAFTHFADRRFSIESLFRWAYHVPGSAESVVFTFSLSAAAVCHWAHLAWHQQNVERYLRWFNHIIARQNLVEIEYPRLELGLRPVWIVAGLVLAAGGALWALPVLLAAGAHHRYIRSGSFRMRSALADRLRQMLLARRPVMRVPKPVTVVTMCVRPNCRAPLSDTARFCPRCGTRVWNRMNVVA